MGNDSRSNLESLHKNNDEIDIAELILKIWRMKWLVMISIFVITGSTFIYLILSPTPQKTYTAKSTLAIGIVGSYAVQSPDEIINLIKKELYNQAHQNSSIINDITPANKLNTTNNAVNFETAVQDSNGKLNYKLFFIATDKSIDFSVQTLSANESVKRAKMIGDFIIKKHSQIYANVINQVQYELSSIKRMSVFVGQDYIKMKLLYENEKHPTDYIIEPFISSSSDSSPEKKIILKTTIAFMTSLFIGIFISLIIDYASAIRKEIKEKAAHI